MPPKKSTTQELVSALLETPITLDGHDILPSEDLLINLNDQALYAYEKGAWHYVPQGDRRTGELAKALDEFLRNYPERIDVNNSKIGEVRDSLFRSLRHTYTKNSLPPLMTFEDLTLDLNTFETKPHDRKDYSFQFMPFTYAELDMPTPHFDKFLSDTFRGTSEKMYMYVLQMLGYYLTPSKKEPAIFFLYGGKRTGKTTMINLIKNIIDGRFISSFTLHELTTTATAVAGLVGKRINIVDEDESDYVKGDKIKALATGASMTAKRLYEQEFSMIPTCKFMFAANEYPRMQNVDDAVMRRLHVLEFKNEVAVQDQDKEIDEKLKSEIPGIVGKALIGLRTFIASNQTFDIPDEVKESNKRFTIDSVPIKRWFDECCEIHDVITTPNKELYRDYVLWCDMNGHKASSSNTFGRQIFQIEGVEESRTSNTRSKNVNILNPSIIR